MSPVIKVRDGGRRKGGKSAFVTYVSLNEIWLDA
jgi:hypothetical protein